MGTFCKVFLCTAVFSYLSSTPLSLPDCVLLGPVSGLNEEDLKASLATMQALASACGADMSVLRERQGEEGRTADCLVRRRVEEDDFMEVRCISDFFFIEGRWILLLEPHLPH